MMNGGKQMRNVWDIPVNGASEKTYGKHPAQKPISIIERLVLGATKENDLVLDPFMGSGTLPLACEKNSRKSVNIEVDKKYGLIVLNVWTVLKG